MNPTVEMIKAPVAAPIILMMMNSLRLLFTNGRYCFGGLFDWPVIVRPPTFHLSLRTHPHRERIPVAQTHKPEDKNVVAHEYSFRKAGETIIASRVAIDRKAPTTFLIEFSVYELIRPSDTALAKRSSDATFSDISKVSRLLRKSST